MTEITIVYWRDIPAQLIAGRGRRAIKLALPPRFEAAIDRAAMASGATASDAYLADWHRAPADAAPPCGTGTAEPDTSPEASLAALAARLEAEYDPPRLRALVSAGGRHLTREEPRT